MSEPNNRIISDCSRTNQISLMINQECVNLKKNSIFKDEESRLDAIERMDVKSAQNENKYNDKVNG